MSEMIEVDAATAKGAALDWLVSEAASIPVEVFASPISSDHWPVYAGGTRCFRPSTDWAQGGPLIERYIGLMGRDGNDAEPRYAECADNNPYSYANGPTFLIAAMRAIVVAKLGDRMEVPAELMEATHE